MSKSRGSNKTVCRNWNGTPGSCSYGNNCRFLHSSPSESNRSTGTRCRNWNGTPGSCQFGERCRFLHSQPDDPFSSTNSLSNAFSASSNPFVSSSNPFASNGFAAAANPFGTPGGPAAASSNGFAGNAFGAPGGGGFGNNQGGFGMQQNSSSNPFQQNQNNAGPFGLQPGQSGNIQQALNLHLNPSRIAQNLMDYRTPTVFVSDKLAQEDCISVPCDIDGDVSPEEVRWEYIKMGGKGCDGNSTAAANVNQAIAQHMSLLGQYYNSGMNDPNFLNNLMQSWQTKTQEHNSIKGSASTAPSSGFPQPFGNSSPSQGTPGFNQSNNAFGQNSTAQPINQPFASSPASFQTPSKTESSQNPTLQGLITPTSAAKNDTNSAAKVKSPERAPRTPITAEQSTLFLQSEMHEYQSPQFSSLSSIPIYALPRDCDLA